MTGQEMTWTLQPVDGPGHTEPPQLDNSQLDKRCGRYSAAARRVA